MSEVNMMTIEGKDASKLKHAWVQVRRVQRLAHRRQLVGQGIRQDVADDGQVRGARRQRRLAQRRLQPQAREPVTDGGVRDDPGAARVHRTMRSMPAENCKIGRAHV